MENLTDPKSEQFETHFTNLAEEIGDLILKHDKLDCKSQIFIFSFLITEYFLHQGMTIDEIEKFNSMGMQEAIKDYKYCGEFHEKGRCLAPQNTRSPQWIKG